jgi:hypothetical protein
MISMYMHVTLLSTITLQKNNLLMSDCHVYVSMMFIYLGIDS